MPARPDDDFKYNAAFHEQQKRLTQLAGAWYSTNDPSAKLRIVKEYHDTYHNLRKLGWNGPLDIEVELPDEFMPQDYLDRYHAVQR